MPSKQHVYRFAVGGPSVRRSAVYRAWSQASASGNTDVYLALRRMGSEFKLSLHEPREKKPARAHISVSEDTQAEVRLANRFLNVWPRVDDTDALENEFHIIFPT